MKHILEPVFPKVELILTSSVVKLDLLTQSYASSHIEKMGSEMDCFVYHYSCTWLASKYLFKNVFNLGCIVVLVHKPMHWVSVGCG